MSYREQDIKHQTKDFWVLAVGDKGFEVYQTGITVSTRVASVGHGENLGLPRAIKEADKRQTEVDAYRLREGLRDYPLGGMSMEPTINWTISKIIQEVLAEHIEKRKTDSRIKNRFFCGDFADDVLETLPGGVDGSHGFKKVKSLHFMIGQDDEELIWDWKLLKRHWDITPPEDLTLEEFEAIYFAQHVWITDDKLHYDAECPEGVKSFFDLPHFKRGIEEVLKEKAARTHREAA